MLVAMEAAPDDTAAPCILSDGSRDVLNNDDRAGAGRGAIRVLLSRHAGPIIAAAFLSFAVLKLAQMFLGIGAPGAAAARVLCSICVGLAASCFWSNVNVTVLRMVLWRPRYAHASLFRMTHAMQQCMKCVADGLACVVWSIFVVRRCCARCLRFTWQAPSVSRPP